jgi:KDO2-lipid IV(A) lauroyltransferase
MNARKLSFALASGLLSAVSTGIRLLPPRARYLPADAISAPLSLLPRLRSITTRNFAIMLGVPPSDPLAALLAQESIRHYGRMAIDFLVSHTESAATLRMRAKVVGAHEFYDAQRDERGVILSVPHMGSWDVGAVIAEAIGIRITVVTESNWVADLVAGSRMSHGVTLVPRGHSLRTLFRALARRETVVLLSDVANDGVQSMNVPFFGHLAPFPIGPARLATRTGAPIVIVFAVRLPDLTYRVEVLPALRARSDVDVEENVGALTAAIAADFQRIITAYPAHWYPFHPIWPDLV